MAESVNKVILIGNLGQDPESRTMQSGGKVVSFSLATWDSWTDENSGERHEGTQWHNIAIFNEQLAGVAERYLKKGSKVYIEGQLETRKWQDSAGNANWTTEVVLRPYHGELTMLDAAHGEVRDGEAQGGAAGAQVPLGGRAGRKIPTEAAWLRLPLSAMRGPAGSTS